MSVAGLALICLASACTGRKVHAKIMDVPSRSHEEHQVSYGTSQVKLLQNKDCFRFHRSMEDFAALLLAFINVAAGLQIVKTHCEFVGNACQGKRPRLFAELKPVVGSHVKMAAMTPDYMDDRREEEGYDDIDVWAAEIEEQMKKVAKGKPTEQPKIPEKEAKQQEKKSTPVAPPRQTKAIDWDFVLRGITDGSARRVARRAADLALRAAADWDTKFTKFLDPLEAQHAMIAVSRLEKRHNLGILAVGGYPGAERQRLAVGRTDVLESFGKEYLGEEAVALVTVSGRELQQANAASLSQRDFLGAILGAGFDRSFVGDILILKGVDIASLSEVEANSQAEQQGDNVQNKQILQLVKASNSDPEAVVAGQFLVDPIIVEPLLESLKGVGNVRNVEVTRMPLGSLCVPEAKTEEKSAVLVSLRLDAVVAGAFRVSRADAAELVRKGRIKVNFRPLSKATVQVADGDLLSCRGKGRIKVEVIGETQRGRVRVNFLHFL